VERLKREGDKMCEGYNNERIMKIIEEDLQKVKNDYKLRVEIVKGKYLEIVGKDDETVITAFNHKGEIEEIITEETIKNFGK